MVTAIIKEDARDLGINELKKSNAQQDYIRVLPSIALAYTNPKAVVYKVEFGKTEADLAQPQDDPKYAGAILYDNETRASHKLFRVSSIQFVRSFSKTRQPAGKLHVNRSSTVLLQALSFYHKTRKLKGLL
jgi:hypothetical protein